VRNGGANPLVGGAGDILVHLFKPEARVMYALEKVRGELDKMGPG
jgi:ribosomal silencing factor RsfS